MPINQAGLTWLLFIKCSQVDFKFKSIIIVVPCTSGVAKHVWLSLSKSRDPLIPSNAL